MNSNGSICRALSFVIGASGAFLGLTIAAMLVYPGGRVGDVNSVGYSFFTNFFSDLGQTVTYGGHSNLPSLFMFCVALLMMALGMAVFFWAYVHLFVRGTRARLLANIGALCGTIAALCFIGVAATPWNLYLQAHNDFVQWAFRAFLAAIVFSGAAGLTARNFPRRFAYVFGGFAVLLAAYIAIMMVGPPASTPSGAAVQATAQKIIVYASILTVLIQAVNARRYFLL